jgi:hypothetical protein
MHWNVISDAMRLFILYKKWANSVESPFIRVQTSNVFARQRRGCEKAE